jgi:hypothetical protein
MSSSEMRPEGIRSLVGSLGERLEPWRRILCYARAARRKVHVPEWAY